MKFNLVLDFYKKKGGVVSKTNVKILTEEMLDEQRIGQKRHFEEPIILSRVDKVYKSYVDKLTGEVIANLITLCEILMNPLELIFTNRNVIETRFSHPSIEIDNKQHSIGDAGTLILRSIRDKKLDKEAILHDLCALCGCFSKDKYPYMHTLKIKIYNYLFQESYLQWC